MGLRTRLVSIGATETEFLRVVMRGDRVNEFLEGIASASSK